MATNPEIWQRFQLPGTPTGPFVKGNDIVAAAEISVTHPFHVVTGSTQVTSMNPPYAGFIGWVYLLWTNADPGGVGTGGTSGKNFSTAKDPAQNTITGHFFDGSQWHNTFPLS